MPHDTTYLGLLSTNKLQQILSQDTNIFIQEHRFQNDNKTATILLCPPGVDYISILAYTCIMVGLVP